MKRIILFCLLLVGNLFAQQDFQWIKSFGISGTSDVPSVGPTVTTDLNNNVIIAGEFKGSSQFGQTTLTSNGNSDIFICKLDASGNFLWAVSAGSTDTDYASAVSTDANGDIYLSCSIRGAATFGTVNIAGGSAQKGCLVKFDQNGVVQWVQTLSGSTNGMGSIAISGSTIYVSAFFTGSVGISNITLNSAGSIDGFVASLDLSGNANWAKSFGGSSDESCAIRLMDSGKLYGFGDLSGSATFGNIAKIADSNGDGFLFEMDDQGNFKWVELYGGAGYDTFSDIAIHGSSLFALGRFAGSVAFGDTQLTAFGTDVFVGRIDSLGKFEWVKRIGETTANAFFTANNPSSIAVDEGGNVYATGEFQGTHSFGSTALAAQLSSYTTPGPGTPSSFDVYISKLNRNGDFLNAWKAGGTEREKGTSITVSPNNEIYLTGFFHSNPFVTGPVTSTGPENCFVLKMSADLTIGINELDNSDRVVVFPNPTSNNIYIKSEAGVTEMSISLFNTTGSEVLNVAIQNETRPVSVGHLPSGVYFLKVTTSTISVFRKIVIE